MRRPFYAGQSAAVWRRLRRRRTPFRVLASRYHVSISTISRAARKLGLAPRAEDRPPPLTKRQRERTQMLWRGGLGLRDIACRLHVGIQQVYRVVRGFPGGRHYRSADGPYVREWLRREKWSHARLARYLCISRRTLESWLYERGVPRNCRRLLRLALSPRSVSRQK